MNGDLRTENSRQYFLIEDLYRKHFFTFSKLLLCHFTFEPTYSGFFLFFFLGFFFGFCYTTILFFNLLNSFNIHLCQRLLLSCWGLYEVSDRKLRRSRLYYLSETVWFLFMWDSNVTCIRSLCFPAAKSTFSRQ